MTPSEFKAWFEGFTDAMSGPPTKAQWAKIKERVDMIDGTPISPVVIREYWPRYYPWYTTTGGCSYTTTDAISNYTVTTSKLLDELGRSDYSACSG